MVGDGAVWGGGGCRWFGGAGWPNAAPGSCRPRGRLLSDGWFLADEKRVKQGDVVQWSWWHLVPSQSSCESVVS